MECLKYLVSLLVLVSLVVSEEKTRYDGYRLIKITPKTYDQVQLLGKWQHNPEFDVWNRVRGIDNGVDVALSPDAYEKYKPLFEANDLAYKILDDNIQNKIEKESASILRSKILNAGQSRVVGTYARHADINNWLDTVANDNSYATSYIAGTTVQGRQLKVLKLKTASTRRSIWIDCGIHAREWISPATCISFIDKLTSDYNKGEKVAKELLDYYEIHILPSHNPDGYEYSQTTSRLWRKNRVTNTGALGNICPGVDLNRNYGYQWMVAGASSSPCSDTFAGAKANDQLETQAVQNVINSQLGKWDAFITIHSYGQWYFTPWGYTTALPADYNLQKSTVDKSAAAIFNVDGRTYTTGSSAQLLYSAAGCSSDWSYGQANILHSYTIELRPGDNTPDASAGFVLPESSIVPVGEEIYAGLRNLFQNIKSL